MSEIMITLQQIRDHQLCDNAWICARAAARADSCDAANADAGAVIAASRAAAWADAGAVIAAQKAKLIEI